MSRKEYFAYGSNLNFDQMVLPLPGGNRRRDRQAEWL